MLRIAYIYYAVLTDLETPLSEQELTLLTETLRNEITSYKKNDDQVRLWAGKQLLRYALNEHAFHEIALEKYSIDEHGRPFIPGVPDFNITHSGKIVALTTMLGPRVGIDVEKIREMDVQAFTKVFSPKEIDYIEHHAAPMQAFFECWTQKESVMKADGRGMRIPLHNIRLFHTYATIKDRQETWHLYPFHPDPDYKAHICSPEKAHKVNVTKIDTGR